MAKDSETPDEWIAGLFARSKELMASGMDRHVAMNIAEFEDRVKKWPVDWGNSLRVLIYGDFQELNADVEHPALGILIYRTPRKNTVIRDAFMVVDAHVTVSERSVAAVIDASNKLNLLLSAYCLETWGHTALGWWSHLTHGGIAGLSSELNSKSIDRMLEAVGVLPDQVRHKVRAAMYWVCDQHSLLMNAYRIHTLRKYSALWNAFECLVDAVSITHPAKSSPRDERQRQIDELLAYNNGRVDAHFVAQCYNEIVNPGWTSKAQHALETCFGEAGAAYFEECFRIEPRSNRLYDIRNSINHGSIDATNLQEVWRVEGRMTLLWEIVWRMFGFFVPFSVPAGRQS
jgi:hypothetical protein